jgi:hypothetical protein
MLYMACQLFGLIRVNCLSLMDKWFQLDWLRLGFLAGFTIDNSPEGL